MDLKGSYISERFSEGDRAVVSPNDFPGSYPESARMVRQAAKH